MSDRSSTASGDDGSVAFIDDKTPIVVPFLLGQLERHRKDEPGRPMVVGLNGIQGVGKTTLVNALQQELEEQHGLRVVVCSIDDFYLPHHEQVALARHRPEDALLQHRGQPGTRFSCTFFVFPLTLSPPAHDMDFTHRLACFICNAPP